MAVRSWRSGRKTETDTAPSSCGSGFAKTKRLTQADRGRFAKAEVEPKKKLAEFRVDNANLLDVGDVILADHFVPGQKVDVTGITIGRGFTGAMKRWNFRGLEATQWRVDLSPLARRYGGRQDPARPSRTRRCTVTMATNASRPRDLEIAKVDVERGLIMNQGRRSRAQGRLGHGARCGQTSPTGDGAHAGFSQEERSQWRQRAEGGGMT